ncbi:MAG: Fur family transcriptional regulator [Chloroflexota bacterium]
MDRIQEYSKQIRGSSRRLTRSRTVVLQVLAEADEPLDAAAILDQGRKLHPGLGRISVYRTLDLLVELGAARLIHAQQGAKRYALAHTSHSHHLLCRNCGHMVEFSCDGLEVILQRVSGESGFKVQGHLLQLEGLCRDCQ